MTVTFVVVWLTAGMVQLASPLASVVPLQDCEPIVKVTTLVGSGVSLVGVFVVSVPVNVTGCPFTAVVGPVYVTPLVSGVTVKLLELLDEPFGGDVCEFDELELFDESPAKDAVRV